MGFGSHILLRRRHTTHVMLCFDLKHVTHDLGGGVLSAGEVRHEDVRDVAQRMVFFSEVRGHTGMNADNLSIGLVAGGLERVAIEELSAEAFFEGEGNAQGERAEDGVLADGELSPEEARTIEAYVDFLSEIYSHIQMSADNILIRAGLQEAEVMGLESAQELGEAEALLLYEVKRMNMDLVAAEAEPVEIKELQMPVAIVNPLLVHRYEQLDLGTELESEASVNIPTVLVMNFDQPLDLTLAEGKRKKTTPGTASKGELSDITPIDIGASNSMETGIETTVFSGPETHLYLAGRTSISIELRWDDKARDDLLGYRVYVDDVQHNSSIITGTSYMVMDLAQEAEYAFKVLVVYEEGISPWSNTIVASLVDVTDPVAPVGLSGVGNWVSMQIELNWEDNTEEDLAGYNVYANGEKENTGGLITDSAYAFNVQDGKLYENIFVTAVDDSPQANESNPSNILTLLVENPIDGPEDYLSPLMGVCSAPRYEGVVLDWGDNCGEAALPPAGVKSIAHNEKVTLIWDKPE